MGTPTRLAVAMTPVNRWLRFFSRQQSLKRIVDQRLSEVESAIDYHACPDILSVAASIAVWAKKPIDIQPWPFPGEITGMVVGTQTHYAIHYSILAHPMLQLAAICHEFGHIILGDVEVIAGQSTVSRMRYCGDAFSDAPAISNDIELPAPMKPETDSRGAVADSAKEDEEPYDPIAESQAERLGALLRKHWEVACPVTESEEVPSLSSVPQDQQAWERFQSDYYR